MLIFISCPLEDSLCFVPHPSLSVFPVPVLFNEHANTTLCHLSGSCLLLQQPLHSIRLDVFACVRCLGWSVLFWPAIRQLVQNDIYFLVHLESMLLDIFCSKIVLNSQCAYEKKNVLFKI